MRNLILILVFVSCQSPTAPTLNDTTNPNAPTHTVTFKADGVGTNATTSAHITMVQYFTNIDAHSNVSLPWSKKVTYPYSTSSGDYVFIQAERVWPSNSTYKLSIYREDGSLIASGTNSWVFRGASAGGYW